MNNSILQLFEGLTTDQAKELRGRIVPVLEQLRDDIVSKSKTERPSSEITTRGKRNEMYSDHNKKHPM